MRPEVGVTPHLRPTRFQPKCHLLKPGFRQLDCVARVSRDSNSRPSDGIDEAAYRELSPEAREVFKEAQENILALNGSRMRALQELRAANEKIAELEKKLEDAATQITKLATRHTSNAVEPKHVATSRSTPPSINPASLITVTYRTGWDQAWLHFQVDDQPWTSLPGLQMNNEGGTLKISLPGNRMKFVVSNGSGKFDTPNPYGDPQKPKNYEINGPGNYILEGGNLTKL